MQKKVEPGLLVSSAWNIPQNLDMNAPCTPECTYWMLMCLWLTDIMAKGGMAVLDDGELTTWKQVILKRLNNHQS